MGLHWPIYLWRCVHLPEQSSSHCFLTLVFAQSPSFSLLVCVFFILDAISWRINISMKATLIKKIHLFSSPSQYTCIYLSLISFWPGVDQIMNILECHKKCDFIYPEMMCCVLYIYTSYCQWVSYSDAHKTHSIAIAAATVHWWEVTSSNLIYIFRRSTSSSWGLSLYYHFAHHNTLTQVPIYTNRKEEMAWGRMKKKTHTKANVVFLFN